MIRSFLPLGVGQRGGLRFDKVIPTFRCEVKGEAEVGAAAGSILEPGQVGECCGQLDKYVCC